MKKLLSLFIAIAMLIPLCIFVHADESTWRVTDGTLYVSGFDSETHSPWLDYSDDIEKLKVGEGVTEIPDGAFAYLDKLTEVDLPESIEKIGEEAFAYCKALRSFTVGKSVYRIGEGVFRGCSSLESIETDENNTSFIISSGAIFTADRKCLIAYPPARVGNEAIIPPETERIAAYAFYTCGNIEKIKLPDGIVSIGRAAFEECKKLKDINLPESISDIGEKAFYESGICPPYSTRALILGGWYISYNGILKDKISLDSKIKHIASGAFAGSKVRSISMPSSLTTIGDNAFAGCTSLTELSLPEDNASFTVDDGILFDNDKTCVVFCIDDDRDELTLPENIIRVRSGAFRGGIEKITVTNDACTLDKNSVKCRYLYGNEGSSAQKYADACIDVTFRIIGKYYNDFKDVSDDAWYAYDVEYAVMNSLMSGVSKNEFAPESSASRAMLVKVLYNCEGHPDVSGATTPFTDVPEGEWYSDAVRWAYKNKIISGKSETSFAPNDPLSREQFAAILFNYAAYKGYSTEERADLGIFKDGDDISEYAKDAISWANANKIITGMSPTVLNPKGSATRAQMASILRRFITANTTEDA